MRDEKLIIISIGIVCLFIILVILLFYLLFKKMVENRLNRRTEQYLKETKQDWYNWLIEGNELTPRLIPANKTEQKMIEQILIRYVQNISNERLRKEITFYLDRYMETYYRNQIKSRHISIRLNVLQKIIDFRMYFMLDEVMRMLKESKRYAKEEYLQMYKILSFLDPKELMIQLRQPKIPLGKFEFRIILARVELDTLKRFIQQFDNLPTELQLIVIEKIGEGQLIDYVPLLESNLLLEKTELRIRSLKAVARIGYMTDLECYLPFLDSEKWEERLMLARLFLYAPLNLVLPALKQLLTDSSWWVRKQAADTILNHKEGAKVLEAVIEASEDRYAIDIAKEVLGRR